MIRNNRRPNEWQEINESLSEMAFMEAEEAAKEAAKIQRRKEALMEIKDTMMYDFHHTFLTPYERFGGTNKSYKEGGMELFLFTLSGFRNKGGSRLWS